MTIASGSKSSLYQQLPQNLEQLVTGCFDVEQYDAGLELLGQIASPSLVPSQHLLQQLVALCATRPIRESGNLRTDHLRRRKRSRGAVKRLDVSAGSVAAVYTLLHQHQHQRSSAFVDALLSSLPSSSKTSIRETNRARRSMSRRGSDASSESNLSALAAVTGDLVETADHVWHLLQRVNEMTHARKNGTRWTVLATSRSSVKKASKKQTQQMRGTEQLTVVGLLTDAMIKSRHGDFIDSDAVETWEESLSQMSKFQSHRCWNLLDLLTRYWRQQRIDRDFTRAALSSKAALADMRRQLNLLDQIAPAKDRVDFPLLEANEALDAIFAGLCDLTVWIEGRAALERTRFPASQDRRIEVAARLWLELCHLVSLGLIDEDTVVRGGAQRMIFVDGIAVEAFDAAIGLAADGNNQGGSLLSKAYARFLQIRLESTKAKDMTQPRGEEILSCQRQILYQAALHFTSTARGSGSSEEEAACTEAFTLACHTAAACKRFTMLLFIARHSGSGVDPQAAHRQLQAILAAYREAVHTFDEGLGRPTSSNSVADPDLPLTPEPSTQGEVDDRSPAIGEEADSIPSSSQRSSPVRKSSRTSKVPSRMGIAKRTRRPGLPSGSSIGKLVVVEGDGESSTSSRRKRERSVKEQTVEIEYDPAAAEIIEEEASIPQDHLTVPWPTVSAWLRQQTVTAVDDLRATLDAWSLYFSST